MFRTFLAWSVAVFCLAPQVYSQTVKPDFVRDIQPIFRQNCVGCHGPTKQNNGLRLDRRSSVFKFGARRVVAAVLKTAFYTVASSAPPISVCRCLPPAH